MEEHADSRSREGSPLAPVAALEWDPSADVGTPVPANTPVHGPKTAGTQLHFDDLNTLEQIMLSLTNSPSNRQHQDFIASSTPVDSKSRPVETSSAESSEMIGRIHRRSPQNEMYSPLSRTGNNPGHPGAALPRSGFRDPSTGTSAAVCATPGHSVQPVNLLPICQVASNGADDEKAQVGVESVRIADHRIGTADAYRNVCVNDVGTTKSSVVGGRLEYQNWIGPGSRTYAAVGGSSYHRVEVVIPTHNMKLDRVTLNGDQFVVVDRHGGRSLPKNSAASVASAGLQTETKEFAATPGNLESSRRVETTVTGTQVQVEETEGSRERKNRDLQSVHRTGTASSQFRTAAVNKAKSSDNTEATGDSSPKSDSDRSTGSTNSSYRTATEDVDEPPLETSSFANVSWQTSGITKSEIEYRSKKNGSSSDQSSSSLLWVEVQAGDTSKVSKSTSDNVNKRPTSSVRVLSEARHQSEAKSNSSSKTDAEAENAMMKHKFYRHRQRVPQCQSARCQCGCPCHSHGSMKKPTRVAPLLVEDHHQLGRIVEPGSGRSLGSKPPQSLEGMNIHDSTDNSLASVSNGDLTPTCEFLTKLLNEEDAAVRKYGYDFLELHRNSLVTKMRKEFQHLERLNRMISPASLPKGTQVLHTHGQHPDSYKGDEPRTMEHQYSQVQKATKRFQTRAEPTANADPSSGSTSGEPSSSTNHDTKNRRAPNTETFIQQTAATVYSQRVISGHTVNSNGICSQKPISYFVPFTAKMFPTREPSLDKENRRPTSSADDTDDSHMFVQNEYLHIDLRQAFEHNCPTIKASLEQREQMIQHIKEGRKTEQQVKREYFASHNIISPNQSLNEALPKKEPRVMSFKEMKILKEKKLKHLPEVREKLDRMKKEEDKKTNRLLTQVFSRKLRQHTLKGDTNIPYAKSLIRH